MIIETKKLSKSFRSYKKQAGIKGSIKSFFNREYVVKNAVAEFDLEIPKGQILGLLGPNGAGKTTLMKMLTGIIAPSSGELSVMGYHPFERKIGFRKHIALVMGQKSQLWWDIPAYDSFQLLSKYYEIENRQFKQRLDHLSELLTVKDLLHIHIRRLSLGERMKMELMASLLHEPEVIFLDEPTIGLDLIAQQNIRQFLRAYQAEHKTTIILTSHYMADVEALCERLVLILDGKKSFDGSLIDFQNILGKEKYVTFRFSESITDRESNIFSGLDARWSEDFKQVDLRISEADLKNRSIEMLSKFPVTDFQTEKMPIERVMSTLLENPDLL